MISYRIFSLISNTVEQVATAQLTELATNCLDDKSLANMTKVFISAVQLMHNEC